jgi:hypothetical protein
MDNRGSIPGRGRDFLYTTASRPALGATQPLIQWVPGAGHEADRSSPSGAEVMNARSHNSTPPIRFHGVVLK